MYRQYGLFNEERQKIESQLSQWEGKKISGKCEFEIERDI